MDAISAITGLPGRARKRPAKLHADKGYDYKRCRAYLRRRGIASWIARRGVESSEKLGKHRWVVERTHCRVQLYEVFCAVLYLLRSGCQWRMLPEEFPKWRTVHSYFAIWSEPREGGSLLEQVLKNQIGAAREKQGRNACSAFLIIRRAEREEHGHSGLKGYGVGKKASGIKRHIVVDTQGLPHAVP